MSLRDLLFPSPMFNAEDGAGGAGTTDAAATTAETATTASEAAKGAEGQGDKAADTGADKGADKAAATIAGGAADKDETKVVHADFPEDWRQKFAGENKELLKQLERMDHPSKAVKSWWEMHRKLSAGDLKFAKAFPDKGTPEEQAAWRKEAGVPDKPDGYEISLPDGVVLGEEDKPIIESVKAFAHEKNVPPSVLNQFVGWYYAEQDKQLAARAEADQEARQANDDALRAEWGNDYRPNLNAIGNLFSEAPQGLKERFLTARFADGTPLGNDVDTLKFLAGLGREKYPTSALLPNGGATATSRLQEIREMRKTNPDAYWQPAIQAEELQLIQVEQQQKKRSQAA